VVNCLFIGWYLCLDIAITKALSVYDFVAMEYLDRYTGGLKNVHRSSVSPERPSKYAQQNPEVSLESYRESQLGKSNKSLVHVTLIPSFTQYDQSVFPRIDSCVFFFTMVRRTMEIHPG